MLKKLTNNSRSQRGFTIIEVMIVLAIAGLILVVVLIAIPQLQRNQRNESRRSVASRIATEVNSYAGNNNGNYPLPNDTNSNQRNYGSPNLPDTFFGRYLGCDATDCDANIDDPSSGIPVGLSPASNTIVDGASNEVGTVAGSLGYGIGLLCDGEFVTTANANPRNFVLQMRLEGGAIFCTDNQ